MTRKRYAESKSKPASPVSADPNVLQLDRPKAGETKGGVLAGMLVAGMLPNAAVAREWSQVPFNRDADLTATHANVVQAAERVNRGDLSSAEAVLTAQTVTLNAMFANLAYQATATKNADLFERYLRLALKAQSQYRATCETLALLKNPPVFTRQANIASQQVVNNGTMVAASRAGNSENAQNELLEAHGDRLDGSEASQAGACHKALAAVGSLDRPEDRRG